MKSDDCGVNEATTAGLWAEEGDAGAAAVLAGTTGPKLPVPVPMLGLALKPSPLGLRP